MWTAPTMTSLSCGTLHVDQQIPIPLSSTESEIRVVRPRLHRFLSAGNSTPLQACVPPMTLPAATVDALPSDLLSRRTRSFRPISSPFRTVTTAPQFILSDCLRNRIEEFSHVRLLQATNLTALLNTFDRAAAGKSTTSQAVSSAMP